MSKLSDTTRSINKYNETIMRTMDEIRDLLDAPERKRDPATCIVKIEKVLDCLEKQFQLEESGGYLTEVYENFPNWHTQVRHLQEEHRLLHRQLREIQEELNLLPEDEPWNEYIRSQVFVWMDTFTNHQKKENEIIQKSFILEVGVGE